MATAAAAPPAAAGGCGGYFWRESWSGSRVCRWCAGATRSIIIMRVHTYAYTYIRTSKRIHVHRTRRGFFGGKITERIMFVYATRPCKHLHTRPVYGVGLGSAGGEERDTAVSRRAVPGRGWKKVSFYACVASPRTSVFVMVRTGCRARRISRKRTFTVVVGALQDEPGNRISIEQQTAREVDLIDKFAESKARKKTFWILKYFKFRVALFILREKRLMWL